MLLNKYLEIYLNSGFNPRTFHNRCMLHSDIGQVFIQVLGFPLPVTNLYMLRLICQWQFNAQLAQLVSSGFSHCLSFADLPVLCHFSGLWVKKLAECVVCACIFPTSDSRVIYEMCFRVYQGIPVRHKWSVFMSSYFPI